ncbi:MAG: glycosyltransferase [Rhizobium sp.]|nr:glycosyltransferase [Rhizobium sp.]
MTFGVLYLSYTGLLEPLGQSQVLAYQERLAADRPVHILSFERPADLADAEKLARVRARIAAAGIHWHPRVYHRRPSALATLWDIAVGAWTGRRLARRHGLGIVHARSYVASVMALAVRHATGARFLFDMRGFWADERVDGGLWPRGGVMYRLAKRFERRFLQTADHVVSLTQTGVDEMQRFDYLKAHRPPMTVIPTCADLLRFLPLGGQRDPVRFTLGYVGSAGTWYVFEATARAFRHLLARRPEARLLVVNRSEHALIRAHLQAAGVPDDRVELRAASHEEIPALMARMDATAFFIKPTFSKQASAPTKLAEFLGCGIPCLANAGVGDMAGILREDRVGVAVDGFDEARLAQGVDDLLALCEDPGVRERCVASARRHFSLDEGVARYRAIYEALDHG